jgi:hypothetical protein
VTEHCNNQNNNQEKEKEKKDDAAEGEQTCDLPPRRGASSPSSFLCHITDVAQNLHNG